MKTKFLACALFALPFSAMASLPHVGFYQTIDDEINKPKSIVVLYEYLDGDEAQLAGRIIALYDEDGKIKETLSAPKMLAEKVKGNPKMVGLDIVWDMEWDKSDDRFEDGKIMDPKSGSIYSSVIWQDKKDMSKLNVRGKIGPFGRTQVWNIMKVTDLPADLQKIDTKEWKPVITKK